MVDGFTACFDHRIPLKEPTCMQNQYVKGKDFGGCCKPF
jgi:hypothetical protein